MKKMIMTLFTIISITYSGSAKAIRVVTTNAHHHSVQFWLKDELKFQNIKGLPLLHFDSHTDMGFSPSHYEHNGNFLDTKSLLEGLTLSKIKSYQKSLTDISQVIVPAIATKLTSEVHMCMPNWFTRINRFAEKINFEAHTINKAQFLGAKTHRIYPVTNIKNTFSSSPFIHSNKRIFKGASMTFYKCFDNPSINLTTDYILSLDLDILSTNGKKHDHARPISTHRSHGSKISQSERDAFKLRIQKIKHIILKLKAKGASPRIVTIALSTGKEGGDYTPQVLASEANKELTKFFKFHFPSI